MSPVEHRAHYHRVAMSEDIKSWLGAVGLAEYAEVFGGDPGTVYLIG